MALYNFITLALIPGVLLFALGTRPKELGLCPPVKGTFAGTLACLFLPIGFIVWAFVSKGLTLTRLFFLLVHNLLSNGFSEEFFARGMILSQLRALMTSEWALVLQGLVFALIHYGSTIHDEHGNVIRILAYVIALNFPMGLALGFMALRSRSLVMPTIVHISLDTMKDLLGMH
jgi:membrane protease YdiL (CAAX protease family)